MEISGIRMKKRSLGDKKVKMVIDEFKGGALHSGSKGGPLVGSPKQALAIGLSEARRAIVKTRTKKGKK